MKNLRLVVPAVCAAAVCLSTAAAGPYTEPGITPDQCVAWATGYQDYIVGEWPPEEPTAVESEWRQPECALGVATGDHYNGVVSLGPAGEITLTFDTPIGNGLGADFAVYENAYWTTYFGGGLFAELAFVDVSSDGSYWARFPSVSLTPDPSGLPPVDRMYMPIDPTDVDNLAGKHPNNAYNSGISEGTPFDLDDLMGDAGVGQGLIDLNDISFVRLVDIIGDGSALDSLGDPIYDAWPTYGSGGFDLEAVGVINTGGQNVVPEPVSLVFFGTGMLIVGCGVRLRKRDANRKGM